jgi:hypothetical protein
VLAFKQLMHTLRVMPMGRGPRIRQVILLPSEGKPLLWFHSFMEWRALRCFGPCCFCQQLLMWAHHPTIT